MKIQALFLAATLVAGTGASAQTAAPAADPAPVVTPAQPSANTTNTSAVEPGANSFTMDQARERIEEAGYTAVTGLVKDDNGIWRGMAQKDGASVKVALDYKGTLNVQ